MQDLPALFLQGGSIVPLGPAHQHTGEAKPSDDISLLVALDENGDDIILNSHFLGIVHEVMYIVPYLPQKYLYSYATLFLTSWKDTCESSLALLSDCVKTKESFIFLHLKSVD